MVRHTDKEDTVKGPPMGRNLDTDLIQLEVGLSDRFQLEALIERRAVNAGSLGRFG